MILNEIEYKKYISKADKRFFILWVLFGLTHLIVNTIFWAAFEWLIITPLIMVVGINFYCEVCIQYLRVNSSSGIVAVANNLKYMITAFENMSKSTSKVKDSFEKYGKVLRRHEDD